MLTGKLNLNLVEHKAYKLHLWYSIIEGFIAGILALNEFVFIKSLKGSNYQLGLLFQFGVLVYILLIIFNEVLKRVKNKRKLLQYTALITRAPLFLLLLFPHSVQGFAGNPIYHLAFLTIFFIYFLAQPIVYPLINLFLKSAYSHENFGKLYSLATRMNKIVMLVTTLLYGILLDFDNYAFTYIFPIVAVLGIVSVYLLSKIEYIEIATEVIKTKFFKSVKESFMNIVTILKKNKPYFHFEMGFMIYGFAFMISVTVITLYFDKKLHLNYSSVAFYKNAYNLLAIALIPFFGKLLGRIDPRKFAIITWTSILLFILSISMTQFMPQYTVIYGIKLYYWLIPYTLFQGVFAATMALLWSIGSSYFCKAEEAADYQTVHLSLLGLRAAFAPTSGIIIYVWFGFFTTFMLACGSLIIAISLMFWSYRRDRVFAAK